MEIKRLVVTMGMTRPEDVYPPQTMDDYIIRQMEEWIKQRDKKLNRSFYLKMEEQTALFRKEQHELTAQFEKVSSK